MPCHLNFTPNGYDILGSRSCADVFSLVGSLVTLSGLTYAVRHFKEAETESKWNIFIGIIQCIPVVGLIAALLERTIVCLNKTPNLSSSGITGTTDTSLNLWNQLIGDTGAACLAKTITGNSTLTRLDLSTNNIGPDGTACLAQTLEVNSTLTRLDLSANNIGPEGARSVATALTENSTLTTLNLTHNYVDPAGTACLARTLEVNSTLTWLDPGINVFNYQSLVPVHNAARRNRDNKRQRTIRLFDLLKPILFTNSERHRNRAIDNESFYYWGPPPEDF